MTYIWRRITANPREPKFEIKSSENYPCCFQDINPRGALHAEVVIPGGRVLHVFVVHLKTRVADVAILLDRMDSYLDDDVILMGDMNFYPFSGSAKMLSDAGLVNPVTDLETFDHIWVSPSLAAFTWAAPPLLPEMTSGASDHLPFAIQIGLSSP